jgi:phosphoribosylglycinamide formyltransferase 1
MMNNLALFASGSGTNVQNIIEYFKQNTLINIRCILSNREDAYALERAKKFNIRHLTFNREEFYNSNRVVEYLISCEVNFVVLAGFLWLVPNNLIRQYPDRIINIHPALLPDYGGRGMYGMKMHEAVIANGEKESGITIHYVNEHYDEGNIIFQAKCTIDPSDTPETLASKIHKLEYEHYPKIIEQLVSAL